MVDAPDAIVPISIMVHAVRRRGLSCTLMCLYAHLEPLVHVPCIHARQSTETGDPLRIELPASAVVVASDAAVPINIMVRAVRRRGLSCPPRFGEREDELDLGRSRAPPPRGDLEPPLLCGLWECLALSLPLPRPLPRPLVLLVGVSLRCLVDDSTLAADLVTLMCL